jgi:uncharacterized protein
MNPTDSRRHLEAFMDAPVPRPTLGLLYGRRRIGKSTLLEALVAERGGFYWEATRGETPIHLSRLGSALGTHLGVGRLAFGDWEEALQRLVQLGAERVVPVVLDEFGYVLEADSRVDSVVATVLGPGARRSNAGQTRLVLCGSAIAMMAALTAGEAPLRGRAGVEVVMQPDDYRVAATRLPSPEYLTLAARVFAVIGGVVGYATDMVNWDLPKDDADFDRWIVDRVLSPAATLHHEATTLLAEDPTLSGAKATMQHSILSAIANGSVTLKTIARQVGRQISAIDPFVKRLIAAGFVVRHSDPIRDNRAMYALADPFLQFHYAVLEPHGRLLREREASRAWGDRLVRAFDSRVRGPVFEEQARTWVRRFAAVPTLGGDPDLVGPSGVAVNGTEFEIDIVVARGDSTEEAKEREVTALGEVKAGATLELKHLRHLERLRGALGPRAASAKLLLFGTSIDQRLSEEAGRRADVELIDLERLYHGS